MRQAGPPPVTLGLLMPLTCVGSRRPADQKLQCFRKALGMQNWRSSLAAAFRSDDMAAQMKSTKRVTESLDFSMADGLLGGKARQLMHAARPSSS